jgi:hypothetical protein
LGLGVIFCADETEYSLDLRSEEELSDDLAAEKSSCTCDKEVGWVLNRLLVWDV